VSLLICPHKGWFTRAHTHTQTHTPHDDIGRAYASHRAAKITFVEMSVCLSWSGDVSKWRNISL